MMEQLSMFDLMEPKPARPAPWVDDRREVMTNAYGTETLLKLHSDEADPISLEIRGCPCLIVGGRDGLMAGFSTYTTAKPGAPFWSETGFRSWCGAGWPGTGDLDRVAEAVCAHIDAKRCKDGGGGLGGQLVRWWPLYVSQWQGDLSFALRHEQNRDEIWAQWGPERHQELWAKRDADIAKGLAQMAADGIDPNEVGAPRHHDEDWPRFRFDGTTWVQEAKPKQQTLCL